MHSQAEALAQGRRRTLLLLLVSSIMIAGCTMEESGQQVAWAALKVESLELELIDDKKYERYRFGPGGTVSATIGMKNGPIAGPLLYWRIEDGHLIISEKPQSGTYADLHNPRLAGSVLLVQRGLFGSSRFLIKKPVAFSFEPTRIGVDSMHVTF